MSSRTLKLTSPAMRGSDVERFQQDINAELKRWRIGYAIKVDGVYGALTRDTARSVCYGLGLKGPVMAHGATPAIRLKVRNRKLSASERARFDARAGWRKDLKERLEGPDEAVRKALAFARSHIGVTESPAGSNRGPLIDKWERDCGCFEAPWCGCFANAVLKAGGFPDQEWLRYCPWIEGRAKSGEGGWLWTLTPQPGDLILYGRDEAVHVGVVEEVDGGTRGDESTIEGNTTNGPGGDEANGGIVARRHRHKDGSLAALPIRGYARPPWRNA